MDCRKMLFAVSFVVCASLPFAVFAEEFKGIPITAPVTFNEPKPNPFSNNVGNGDTFMYDAQSAMSNGAEIIFPYNANMIYKFYTQMGHVTDIVFEPGEKLTYVGGGDTLRWKLDTAESGNGVVNTAHIYIKPLQTAIVGDFIVNTDKRTYRFMVSSDMGYNPVVRWNYKNAIGTSFGDVFVNSNIGSKNNSSLNIGGTGEIRDYAVLNPLELDFNYKIKNQELRWAPAQVFRSDKKTYIQMKPEVVHEELPALFAIDEEGKRNLVAYRYDKGCFVVDRVLNEMVLLRGKNQKVEISYIPDKRKNNEE